MKFREWFNFTFTSLITFASGLVHAIEGTIDNTYGANGVAIASFQGSLDNRARDIAIVSDSSSLVVGRCLIDTVGYQHCVTKFSAAGTIDFSFASGVGQLRLAGSTGDAYRIVSLSNDSALIAFYCSAGICVHRITAAGSLDSTFGNSGIASIPWLEERRQELADMFVSGDDQIFVAFRCETQSSDLRFCIAKLNAHGALVEAFGTGGVRAITLPAALQVRSSGLSAALSDGGRLLPGICSTFSQGNEFVCAARLDETGADAPLFLAQHESGQYLPSSFPKQHWFVHYNQQNLVLNFGASALQDRFGNLLVSATCAETNYDPCAFRFLPTGRLDAAFGNNGGISVPMGDGDDIATFHLLDDDKLFVVGDCWLEEDMGPFQIYRVCSARLTSSGILDASYGGGGVRREIPTFPSGVRGGVSSVFQRTPDGSFVGIGEVHLSNSNLGPFSGMFATTKLKSFAAASASCALNVDANLVATSSTDALLLIRYFFGFRGGALIDGAIGQSATRDADQIANYLDTLKADAARKLDVDGDGEANALTDGLLILRAMLGLSGDALIAGARNAAHPNVRDARQILTWIETTHGVACLP
jgi:uncharacterized delta-60 repeat protein